MVSRLGSQNPENGTMGMAVAVIAVLAVPIAVAMATGYLNNPVALSHVFGILLFPFALFLFFLAQAYFHKNSAHTRVRPANVRS